MNPIFPDALIDTPVPGDDWRQLSDDDRLIAVNNAIRSLAPSVTDTVTIASARPDGQVIVQLQRTLPANERGAMLLGLEDFLKKTVNPALCVWLEPLGDRNSLRNLRGIEVKK